MADILAALEELEAKDPKPKQKKGFKPTNTKFRNPLTNQQPQITGSSLSRPASRLMLQQATEDLQKEKGVQSQPTDSPTELKAQDRKERDERSNRVHDVEFATEVATSLLSQVRNLQALLAEKEETLKSIKDENSKLKLETDGFHEQLRNLEESEQRYKDENWSLETQIHELLAAAKEAADRETRLTQRLVIMQAERDAELRLKSPSTHQHVNEQKYNLGPIQEALDAANHKILELQAANEKLHGVLSESNKENRLLKGEKANLHDELELLEDKSNHQTKLLETTGPGPLPEHLEESLKRQTEQEVEDLGVEHESKMKDLESRHDRLLDEQQKAHRTIADLQHDLLRTRLQKGTDSGQPGEGKEEKDTAANELRRLEQENENLMERVVELERLLRQSGGDSSIESKDYLQGRLEISTGNYEMLQKENADLKKRSRILSEAAAKRDIRTPEDLIEAMGLIESIRNENANLKAEKKLWKEIQDRLSQDNEDLMNERTGLNNLAANPQTLQNEPELADSEARRRLDQEQLSLSEITGIIFAVTTGDLTQKCVIESAETDTPVMILKRRINDMIDHLRNIFAEVARVAREHGKEGFLGGEVRLSTANGVWKAMIDDVNQMAQTLTAQVRGVASCVEAIVSGDFTQTIQIECAGEILALKNTINNMTWVLHYVVSDVIKFAIEVAEHGLLGGKLDEETRGGDWQKMAEAINSMARVHTEQTRWVTEAANRAVRGETVRLERRMAVFGEIDGMYSAVDDLVRDLNINWTRGNGEAEGRDQKLQLEKLQRIWAILQSNI